MYCLTFRSETQFPLQGTQYNITLYCIAIQSDILQKDVNKQFIFFETSQAVLLVFGMFLLVFRMLNR